MTRTTVSKILRCLFDREATSDHFNEKNMTIPKISVNLNANEFRSLQPRFTVEEIKLRKKQRSFAFTSSTRDSSHSNTYEMTAKVKRLKEKLNMEAGIYFSASLD